MHYSMSLDKEWNVHVCLTETKESKSMIKSLKQNINVVGICFNNDHDDLYQTFYSFCGKKQLNL